MESSPHEEEGRTGKNWFDDPKIHSGGLLIKGIKRQVKGTTILSPYPIKTLKPREVEVVSFPAQILKRKVFHFQKNVLLEDDDGED